MNMEGGSWRNGSEVKSAYCSYRGSGFEFQNPQQTPYTCLCVIPVLKDLCLLLTCTGTYNAHMRARVHARAHTHTLFFFKDFYKRGCLEGLTELGRPILSIGDIILD